MNLCLGWSLEAIALGNGTEGSRWQMIGMGFGDCLGGRRFASFENVRSRHVAAAMLHWLFIQQLLQANRPLPDLLAPDVESEWDGDHC